ncbi:ADP-ribosylglycohydrolase family protein [Murimonas intestini]|uniref:ADP-ribosylglycohydrolase family protein n=1 Tax=Murimonas intestini TaxID=1337051 RepID=UPI0011DDF753|nr:ADP-ribosylglycohydrolase family protein [Murimonas intestini]
MPGYANWKVLYKEEFFQLLQEGYQIEDALRPDTHTGEQLPIPDGNICISDGTEEEYWKEAYEKLWNLRQKGLRAGYAYQEPETFDEIQKNFSAIPHWEALSPEEYSERISGAVHGRFAGVVLGKPLEIGWNRCQVREYLESVGQYPLDDYVEGYSRKLNLHLREDCIPSTRGHIHYVQPDDDVHYTILALLLAEKYGYQFTSDQIGQIWTENIPYRWFWCSSRQAYYNYINLEEGQEREQHLQEIPTKWNPWRECLDGQIRTDLWGYLNPGNPVGAAKLAYRDCSFSLTKNGIYAGMFIAGCISAALTKQPGIDQILDSGLAVIPPKSRAAEAVHNVRLWYQECRDWIPVCDKIYQQYAELPFAAAINNLAIVVLALLHGALDYEKTITTAVMCGLDTDCNAGTAGSIVGAAIGIQNIEDKWTKPLQNTVKTTVASFGEGSISEIAVRIQEVFKKNCLKEQKTTA